MARSRLFSSLLAAILVVTPSLITAQETAPTAKKAVQEKATKFTRFVKTAEGQGRFETAVVTYQDKQGRTVDLVGAVHIGDGLYYQRLQKRFEKYDALLYELVAPEGTVPEPGRASTGFVGMLQRGMKQFLELEFQLDSMDYSKDNFVHADVTPAEFSKLQKSRGENMFTLVLKSMMNGMKSSGGGKSDVGMADLMKAFFSENRAHQLKFIFAQQLDDLEKTLSGFGGEDGTESAIIGDRNAKAFKVLEKRLGGGDKKLGLFYGAAHLPDMEKRLEKMGFKRRKQQVWLTAWDLTEKKPL